MILSQFEEAIWHRRGSDCDIAEAWHDGGQIVSAVEAVLEFGEVAGHMLVAGGAVSASDGALDVAEGGVDPLEVRVQGGLATVPGSVTHRWSEMDSNWWYRSTITMNSRIFFKRRGRPGF